MRSEMRALGSNTWRSIPALQLVALWPDRHFTFIVHDMDGNGVYLPVSSLECT